jgi:hypothetical protein
MEWVWNRAKLVAQDNDPTRVERLARLRCHGAHVQGHEIMVFADELDLHLRPKVGAAWMLKGRQEEVMTPGKQDLHDLASARDLATGECAMAPWPAYNQGLLSDPPHRAGPSRSRALGPAYRCRGGSRL